MKRKLILILSLCLVMSCTFGLIACDITVEQTGIEISKEEIVLGVGDNEILTANIKPKNATDKLVVWESSNESVATITNGTVTAVSQGTATITARTKDGVFSDACQVEVVRAGMTKFLYTETANSCTITGLRDYSTTEIVIPDCVTGITDDAFYDASVLAVVTIGNGVESIDGDWFSNCTNLYSITIGKNVESIGENAFVFCENLIEVINKSPYLTIEQGSSENGCVGKFALDISNCDATYQRKISVDADGFVVYRDGTEKVLIRFVGSGTEVTIPSGITAIGEYAFEGCENLTSVVMTNGITSIGKGAFYGCSSLEKMVLCSGITEIKEYTFYGCESMWLFEMQNGVTTIGISAFNGCSSLEGIVISKELNKIKDNAFDGCNSLTYIYKRDMRGSGGMGSISISDGNSPLYNSFFYYYSPEEPTWLGNYWLYVDGIPTTWETT